MTRADMTGPEPKRLARTAGVLYLLLGVLTGFAGTVAPRMYAAGDAAATAGHLAANAATVRYAVIADLAGAVAWVLLALALYRLLSGFGRDAARALVLFTALGAGIMMLNAVFEFEAMRVATGAVGLSALGAAGSNGVALLLLDTHHYGVCVAQVFFGLWLLPFGVLAWRTSGMIPRWLGAALIAAGACYLLGLLAAFLGVALGPAVGAAVAIVPAVAEVSGVLYLLVIGVRTPRRSRPILAKA
jgi:hypothetical protein